MWKTTNYKGEPVTWYSQDEIDWLMKKLDDANNCLQDCELHWEKERKILTEQKAKATNANIHHLALLSKANKILDYIATKCNYAKGYRHLSSLMPTIYDIEEKIKEYKNANNRPD